jgi:hypothetical protein
MFIINLQIFLFAANSKEDKNEKRRPKANYVSDQTLFSNIHILMFKLYYVSLFYKLRLRLLLTSKNIKYLLSTYICFLVVEISISISSIHALIYLYMNQNMSNKLSLSDYFCIVFHFNLAIFMKIYLKTINKY